MVDVVRENSTKDAMKDGHGNSLTYDQMFDRVKSIATELVASGDKQGATVAVFQERTTDWVCSLLATMYVGATYAPLDLSAPVERLVSIVEDCQPAAILVDEHTVDRVSSLNVGNATVINVSTPLPAPGDAPIKAQSDSPGVILYTSGSTGTPKGIPIRHSSLRNEVEFSALTYGFGVERVLQQSAMSFDMSLTQIFSALAFGGYVFVCPSSVHADPISLTRLMASEQITMTGGTPSEYLSWITNGLPDLVNAPWRVAVSGGEPVTDSLLRAFRSLEKPDLHLFNAYGPTEVTCSSSRNEVMYNSDSLPARIPAGRTAPNAHVYVVDRHLRPLPVGCLGEIVVGGAGIAMGYLHRESETSERFVHDQFAAPNDQENSSLLHRTGDLGRLLSDGSLLIEGRIGGDTQIKLHGIRIDLQDIERAILKAGEGTVIEAVASVRRVDNESPEFIVAHVVLSNETQALGEEFAESLPLPRHMKPSLIIRVDSLPKGSSGKIHRKSVAQLPLQDHPSLAGGSVSAQQLTHEESQLKDIWAMVLPSGILERHNITSKTDFFHVGGNSLLLVNLQQRIRKVSGIHLDLVQMFDSSTLYRMAKLVKEKKAAVQDDVIDWNVETTLPPIPDTPATPLTRVGGSAGRVVVLTGATGYLGQALLAKMVADDSVRAVHCIAVRRSIEELSALSDKVRVYRGDLGSPALGLSPEDAAHIFAQADAIIHNGANVSHLKHYRTLRQENVGSTKELLRLAVPRKIPIHFISSAGISLYTGMREFDERSAAPYHPPNDGADGYTASKWASEVVLERAALAYDGLAVVIHRPSNIKREDVPDLDLFQNLLKFSRLAGAVPSSPNLQGYLNLVGVDDCADGILAEALPPSSQTHAPGCRFLHQIGDVNLKLQDLGDYLAKESSGGVAPETVSLAEWTDRAEALGLHASISSFFRRAEQGGDIDYPLLVKREGR